MSLQQIPLQLGLYHPTELEDYIAGDNGDLLRLLERQRTTENETQIFLHGPPVSGRTHLLMGQCNALRRLHRSATYLPAQEISALSPQVLDGMEQYDLVAIDDIDRLAGQRDWELALFRLFNRVRERGGRLLFSAAHPPGACGFGLPDLSSRLTWGITFRIKPLDDPQRLELLRQLSRRRGLEMSSEVGRYLLERYSRDVRRLVDLVERLDHDSLAEQRRLTVPFVRARLATANGR